MNQQHTGGATLRASTVPPSIDLIALIKALTTSIVASDNTTPLFNILGHGRRINVDTTGVMKRLSETSSFKTGFGVSEGAGFLRDIETPPKGISERIGGHIHRERDAELTSTVQTLAHTIDAALDAASTAGGAGLKNSLVLAANTYLRQLAQSIEMPAKDLARFEAEITPLAFVNTASGRPEAERDRDVARLIVAIEEVDSTRWIERLAKPLARQLEKANLDTEEIEGILAGLRNDANREGSQTSRLLRFIGDDALARARLEVSLSIMGAMREAMAGWASDPSAALLSRYIDRVAKLRAAVLAGDLELSLDASGCLGANAKTNLYDHLIRVSFLRCLPVWPEPVTQLFELRSRDLQGERMSREVSYRFRINGKIPIRGLTIFSDRVARLREVLTGDGQGSHPNIPQHLAELVFLLAVIPSDTLDTSEDPGATAQALIDRLGKGDSSTISEIIDSLAAREPVVERIASSLVKVLREKAKTVVSRTFERTENLWVCLKKSIVNWERLRASTDGREIFVRPESGTAKDEQALWFGSVAVTRDPADEPDVLLAIKASYRVCERTLTCPSGTASWSLSGERELDTPVMPVVIWPAGVKGADRDRLLRWTKGAGVVVGVNEGWLRRRGQAHKTPEQNHQFAASVTAMAILLFVTLRAIRNRLREDDRIPLLLMLRVQTEGRDAQRDDDLFSGSHGLFAVSKAVEQLLGADGPVFMQGLAVDTDPKWQRNGTFVALHSAFPLRLNRPIVTSSARIGLISYGTRPCGHDPSGAKDERHVFNVRSYLATGTGDSGGSLRLWHDRTAVHVEAMRDFEDPTIIFEEIARLYGDGCRQIMLLWKHFGSRRIGRAAQRHAPHANRRFLSRLANDFPDATIYTLSLDLFQATRTATRRDLAGKHAFEVTRVGEHEAFWNPGEVELKDDLIAFYTFATLAVVGDESKRPQSGFCTYFLETSARAGDDLEWSLRPQTNLLGQNRDVALLDTLLAVLRGLHFLHAEREPSKGLIRPCLDPHHWSLDSAEEAGELTVIRSSRRRGDVILSLPAVLACVSAILRGQNR